MRPRAATSAGVSPGDTVPEFEQAMNKLKVDEVSQPVRSPFGWHLHRSSKSAARRTSPRRASATRRARRSAQRKSDEEFQEFMRQVRDRAYVEYKIDDR